MDYIIGFSLWHGLLVCGSAAELMRHLPNFRTIRKLSRFCSFESPLGLIDALVQSCSISNALAMEILQSCIKPPLWWKHLDGLIEKQHSSAAFAGVMPLLHEAIDLIWYWNSPSWWKIPLKCIWYIWICKPISKQRHEGKFCLVVQLYIFDNYTKLKGGYTGFTLCVCLIVRQWTETCLLCIFNKYSSDPFHICTSYQATSEGVPRVKFVSKFKNLKFWQIL